MPLTAAQKKAKAAYEASQRAAAGQHSIATVVAKGVKPSGPDSVLGTAPTPGLLGKGYAPPPVTPQPFDPALEAQRLGATWNVQLADSEAGFQRGETAWGSGYNADGSLNSSNPYSQAMLLQDSYKRGVAGTNNSMAAQGQLYSGARLNAQAHNDRVYAEQSSAQKDTARQAYHGIDYGRLSTYGQNSLGVSGADYDALRRAVYGG